jgi:very-short-patch-repair endonuclease
MDGSAVTLTCSMVEHVSVAFQQNAIPVVQEIAVTNSSDRDLSEIEIHVATEPAFAHPTLLRIDRLAAGATHYIRSVDIRLDLDAAFLRKLTEGLRGEFRLSSRVAGEAGGELTVPVRLQPPSHWGGSLACPELVAAFVRPNDPTIDVLLHDTSRRLTAAGKNGALDGYRAGRRERAWEIAGAAWSALAALGITYVLPPASFERSGQKVRGPGDVAERRTGTCFDLTLLYAALLEQAGLNPLVVLTRGHAFVGLWLRAEEFSTAVVDDMQVLRKRRDLEDLIFVETTALTATPPMRFAEAVKLAARHIDEEATEPLEIAVDIRRARAMGITPLDLGDGPARPVGADDGAISVDLGIDDAPTFTDEIHVSGDEDAPEVTDRLERWKRKLLDLTLRNKLLNFKDGKKSVTLDCPDVVRLEDLLAGGAAFRLLPRSEVLAEGDVRDAGLWREHHHDDGRLAYLRSSLEAKDLHTTVPEKDLDGRLTELYRMTRTAFEEGGANVLFLAVGFLKWCQKPDGAALRAPLLLLPVSLQRRSVHAGFRLALHEDEPRFNPTLLELLRQDFRLRIPDLEKELPTDASGIDVARIFRIVRQHVLELKGWEVTEEVVLSTFSFAKFLMWRDLVERMEDLKKNPIVRHLVDTPKETYGDAREFPAAERIDVDHHPRDLFAPLSADSSQLAAVLAAASGKDFVLFGPPGTGKSQTIANMISQCLALGKTVLFVSQKTAALEVVQRRLRDIGLADYCLEVHSAKAQKSSVLEQLKSSWHERAKPSADEWALATERLARLRDELNRLVDALHRRHPNGMTAYEAFGLVVANRDRFPGVELTWTEDGNRERLDALRALCADLTTMMRTIGDPTTHPLTGVLRDAWSPLWRKDLEQKLGEAIRVLPAMRESAVALASALDLAGGATWTEMRGLVLLAGLFGQPEAVRGVGMVADDLDGLRDVIADLERLQARAAELSGSLSCGYRPVVFQEDLRRLLADWTEAANANVLFRSGRKKKIRQTLQPFALAPLPDDIGAEIAGLLELAGVVAEIQGLGERLSVFGKGWSGAETDAGALKERLGWVEKVRKVGGAAAGAFRIQPQALFRTILRLTTDEPHRLLPDGDIGIARRRCLEAWQVGSSLLRSISETTIGEPSDRPPVADGDWVPATVDLYRRWLSGLDRSPEWCRWQNVAARAVAGGLQTIIDAVSTGAVAPTEIATAFEVAHARWWATRLVERDAVLRGFLAAHHEDVIARYRAADDRIAELSKTIVRAKLVGSVPLPTAFGKDPEWGILAHELVKKQRHMPLRQLFSSIPTALTRLTPCLMMSPLSIAQYLPPDSRPFDVVIFDEASQIPVWDAIGAIARGRQVVIAGDPEQLPPTSVGERGVDEIEDGTDVEDQESILSECIASNIPSRCLDWHYRSRHESLIAFSNREYYGGRLVTFPSPVTEDRAVRYVHVPGGVYERGSGRVNREEARTIVAELLRRLSDPEFEREKHSIGIVTFNGEQQRLIENLLDAERRSDPALEPFFDPARWHEPVFVKNLENVQGDERDTIIFSVAVAPDAAGRGVSTISSLNKDGGYRRLNVAITRARREMVVFATLRPDQIDLSRSRSRGVRDFKHFLEFAERGPKAFAEAHAPGEGTDSPFEDAVKAALERCGWEIHTQIGVSGFRVDLGVVDPDRPGRYLAGVECDGATYHRSATARDRDRLRQTVLEGLGWTIRRVWSTEWWQDADGAASRLHERLTADLEASRAAAAAAAAEAEAHAAAVAAETVEAPPEPSETVPTEPREPVPAEPAELAPETTPGADVVPFPTGVDEEEAAAAAAAGFREPERHYAAPAVGSAVTTPPAPPPPSAAPYRVADPAESGFAPDPDLFYDVEHRHRIRAMVAHVIAVEGPIYDDLLVHRIAHAHGFKRAAGRIRELVLGAIDPRCPRTKEEGRTLYWPLDGDPTAPVPFRGTVEGGRDNSEVPLAELVSLARTFIESGADREEAIRRMATTMGLAKLREGTRRRFEQSLSLL